MATNNLSFTVSCVDKATAQVQRINNAISKMTRPLTDLQRKMQTLGKAAGADKLAKSLGKVAARAKQAGTAMLKLAAPLLAIVGGGTLAGVFELATAWARVGAELSNTGQILGLSTDKISAIRGAGELAGVSAQSMTGAFKGLQNTLQDAFWGRNQGAASMLQYLGISLQHTKDGAIDTQDAMLRLADKIKVAMERDPAAGRRLAAMFGLEEALPLIMQGSEAVARYQERAQQLSGVTPEMTARATAFSEKLKEMGMATDGIKNAIGDRLIPILQPLIERWTAWMVANRELISQKVAQFVDSIAQALERIDWNAVIAGTQEFLDRLEQLIGKIGDAVKSVGGWGNALKIVGGIMLAAFVAPLVTATAQLGLLLFKLGAATVGMLRFGAAATKAGAAATAAGTAGRALGGGIGMAAGLLIAPAADAAAGALGVGGKDVDTKRDDANWSKMTGWEKFQSGSARGIEKLGDLLGMGNIANEARAGRIERESAYLTSQGRIASPVKPINTPAARNEPVSEAIKEQTDGMKRRLEGLVVQPGSELTRLLTSIDSRLRELVEKIGAGVSSAAAMVSQGATEFVGKVSEKAAAVVKFFQGKGWSKAQASGIAANLQAESSFNHKIVGDKGSAFGLGQWHADRQAKFRAVYGKDIRNSSFEEQLGFVDWELRNSERGAGDRLSKAQSAREAGGIVSMFYERPANVQGDAAKRGALAERIAQSAAPVVNVSVNTQVARDGSVQTRVTTPGGVKIAQTNPIFAGVG